MNRLYYVIVAFMAIVLGSCSSTKTISEADIMAHNAVVSMLSDKDFMVKADRLILDKRSFPSVSPSTNFVKVEGDDATVQISPGFGGGPNGVGGFTVKGRITAYEVNQRSNGAVSVKFNVQASVGSCMVFINLPKAGIVANVQINNNLRGKNATIYGEVQPIDNTIFVGRSK